VNRFAEVVNVRDFGALGNGVANDTAAIQAAINTAQAIGAGLYIPAANYLTSATLSITAPLAIVGSAGATNGGTGVGTRIFTNTLGINLINLTVSAAGGNDQMGGSIRGIQLDGNSKAAIGLNITGPNTVGWSFYELSVVKNTHLGTYISGNHSFRFHNCLWALNGITSNIATDGGLQLDGANAVNCYGCNSEANYGSGVLVSAGYNNGWHSGVIEGNNYHGIIGTATGQHFTAEDTDFEANNQAAAANTFDIDISAETVAHWCVQNLKFATAVDTTNNIRVKGAQTIIRNVRGRTGKTVLWTSTATGGLMEFDIDAYIDPTSVINNQVNSARTRVLNTYADGMGVTTPAVPASTVEQVNLLFQPVAVYITAVGTTTNWSIIDGGGRSQAMGVAVNAGFLCMLPPGHGIKITYSSVPSWKWYAI
jgi:hypothetical protein